MDTLSDEKTCRLCFNKSVLYLDIFNSEETHNIRKKCQTIFNINIDETDFLPTTVCSPCYEKIDNFYSYYSQVMTYHKCFSFGIRIIENSNNEPNYLYFDTESNLWSDITTKNPENNVSPKSEEEVIEETSNSLIEDEKPIEIFKYEEEKLIEEENEESLVEEEIDEDEEEEVTKTSKTRKRKKSEENLLPEHLNTRTTKAKGDAQIREFVSLCCDICEKRPQFDTFKKLQFHYESKHECRGYINCCEKKFYRKDRLMNHIINHINPEAFKCPKCGQKSKSKILLRIHMKQHLPIEDRPYQCNCGQKFVLKSQLTNHEASHFTPEQKKYVCDFCGKAFALKFVMMKHTLTHSKERNFVCELCAKSFLTKSNLQTHIKNHNSGPTPRVQCKICSAWYKNLDTLRTHMRRHKDLRQHICSTCQKQCTTKSSLSAHIRYVHLKVKDFDCKICDRQFRRRLELTEHMARHTGQALYRCPWCVKTFTSSSNYFSHRKNKHPSEFATIANRDPETSENGVESI